MTGATVSTQSPTFAWQLAPGTDGATIELCRDRAISMSCQTIDVTGSSGTTTMPLVRGVWFWRLRPRSGSVVGSRSGSVWSFVVPGRSAPHATSWGAAFDENGDGRFDLAVGGPASAPQPGQGYVFRAANTGVSGTATTMISGLDASGEFGKRVASAGDVDGDGYSDLVIGAPGANGRTGRAFVYAGGASGIGVVPTVTLDGPDAAGNFGSAVASAGDLNGDGYSDLLVGASCAPVSGSCGGGRVILFTGSATGVTRPGTVIESPSAAARFGDAIAGAGDINGDGLADFVIGAPNAMGGLGQAFVFLGAAGATPVTPTWTLTGTDANGHFGSALAMSADVNGDGYSDLAVGAPNAGSIGRVFVYLGGATGIAMTPSRMLDGIAGPFGAVGSALTSGDVDGDGFDDLAVGAPGAAMSAGAVYVYRGSSSGLNAAIRYDVSASAGLTRFGASLSVGDSNGDGYGDLAIGAPSSPGGGAVRVYLGSSSGLPEPFARTLPSPVAGAAFGTALSF
jgi:hypothetical protein